MNLHAIVSAAIGAVNPFVLGTLRVASAGVTMGPGYKPIPNPPTDYPDIPMQVQPLSTGDIDHLASLNIQGVQRAVYLNGDVRGLQRRAGIGGDVLVFDGKSWLVTAVLEAWDANGWTKVGVTQQIGN